MKTKRFTVAGLPPCPHCGSNDLAGREMLLGVSWVTCETCAAQGPPQIGRVAAGDAWARTWNKKPLPLASEKAVPASSTAANVWAVGRQGVWVVSLVLQNRFTIPDALNLAAWIVAMTCLGDHKDFLELLDRIERGGERTDDDS